VSRAGGMGRNVAVKPIVSASAAEARRRVLTHYKQWLRATPEISEYVLTFQSVFFV